MGHLRQNGFSVKTEDAEDLAPLRARYRIPRGLESCHIAAIGPYVVEGHVPAATIKRLLREKPAVLGLAVPGMPQGSPGMEAPGGRAEPYTISSFDRQGTIRVYERR